MWQSFPFRGHLSGRQGLRVAALRYWEQADDGNWWIWYPSGEGIWQKSCGLGQYLSPDKIFLLVNKDNYVDYKNLYNGKKDIWTAIYRGRKKIIVDTIALDGDYNLGWCHNCSNYYSRTESWYYKWKTINDNSNKSSSYDTHIGKLCKEAEIKPFGMHVLRHTFATRCIESGMNPKTLQKILGHASIKTTMDTYVDVTNDSLHEGIELLPVI